MKTVCVIFFTLIIETWGIDTIFYRAHGFEIPGSAMHCSELKSLSLSWLIVEIIFGDVKRWLTNKLSTITYSPKCSKFNFIHWI